MSGGGAERQTINYLRYLDRERYEPLLYLHYRRGEYLALVPDDVPVIAFWDRHQPPRIPLPGRIFWWQVRDLAQVLTAQRIDVVCSVTFLATLVAYGSVGQRTTPWIAIEMADPRLDFRHQVKRFRWLKRLLLARAYRHADFAVAVSEGVREGMQQTYQLSREHTPVVRNFVDLAEIDRLARQAGPCPEPGLFHVVTVGRLDEQKGQIYLLKAMSHMVHRRGRKDVHLSILGQGPLEKNLKSSVREEKLDDYVTFFGFLSNPFAFIARCQLFCLPSIYEGLPLALLEGMACRVPVLATDCLSGPREVLAEGRFGRLVETGSSEHLADAIEDAIDHHQDWLALVEPARRRIEREFSVESEMARLQRLIDASFESRTGHAIQTPRV